MANYKETSVSGESWVRCRSVTINNPLPGKGEFDSATQERLGAVAYFQEEKIVSIDGTQIAIDVGACRKAFDPEAVITLLNPDTGDPTGATVTQGDLYVILYSLYMQTALERDALNA